MRLRLTAVLLLVFLSCSGAGFSQQTNSSQDHDAKLFLRHLREQEKQIWTSPIRKETWGSPDTYIFLGVSAASISLDGSFSEDLREAEALNDFNRLFASDASDIVLTLTPLAFLAVGQLSDSQRFREFGWKATEALGHTMALSFLLKAATQRARPHTGEVYGFWEGGNSFPSGHAMLAWSLAAVAVRQFPQKRWLPWVVYPAASLIAFSRVTSGNHFVSDAVTGSFLGYMTGRYAIN